MGESSLELDRGKSNKSLMGKLCSEKSVGKVILQTTIGIVWKISKIAVFKEMNPNLFIITFNTEVDKIRVLEGRPWLFDNYLLAMRPIDCVLQPNKMAFGSEAFWIQLHNLLVMCMNIFYSSLIGGSIRRVVYVDVEDDDTSWGSYLRVGIEVPLDKSLVRGKFISVKWVSTSLHGSLSSIKNCSAYVFIVGRDVMGRNVKYPL